MNSDQKKIVAELAKARLENDAHKIHRHDWSEEDLGYLDYSLEEAREAVEGFCESVGVTGGEPADE